MLYIKQLHKELTNAATDKRDKVLSVLGLTSITVFYDILDGKRSCTRLEQDAIAKIYGVSRGRLFKSVASKPCKSVKNLR